MNKLISINSPAPDFSLKDFNGKLVKLSEYQERKNVLLVFNRGFA
jgi:peroxiredoxin